MLDCKKSTKTWCRKRLRDQEANGSSNQSALWTSMMLAGEERWMDDSLKWGSTEKSSVPSFYKHKK